MKLQQYTIRALCVSSLISVAAFMSGCASIIHGGSRTITMNTQPTGAKVTVTKAGTGELVHSGSTPLTVSLDPKRGFFKGQSYNVSFELAGYRTEQVLIRSELSGWYFGNIIFGGVIGMVIVDPATGSMWNLSPDKIDRPLTTQQAALLKSGDGFLVTLVSEITETERSSMVKIN